MTDAGERQHWAPIAGALQVLRQAEGWDTYMGLLEDAERSAIQTLLTVESTKHDYWVGFVMGLRSAAHMPEQIIERVKQLDTARESAYRGP